MAALTYTTAGESHGPCVLAVVSGLPAGLSVDAAFINAELARRQGGYGRGGRQSIEQDVIEVLSGVRNGRTIGSPLTLVVRNKDSRLDDAVRTPPVHVPRPGHADFAGGMKYLTTDCRSTLERASARETAARVAAGAISRCLLGEFGIEVFAFVRAIHQHATDATVTHDNWRSLRMRRDESETYCPDAAATERQREVIRQAKIDKTTLGGLIECHAFNLPPGLGSTMDRRDRLDARIAGEVMGIQAIKGVEIGLGFAAAARAGHEVHDAIRTDVTNAGGNGVGFTRDTNNAGGIEGGMSNGMPIVVRAAMKPISTLLRGMASVDLTTRREAISAYERSDICAAPAASVVMENVVAFEIARVLRDKFGGDSLDEMRRQVELYFNAVRAMPDPLNMPRHEAPLNTNFPDGTTLA